MIGWAHPATAAAYESFCRRHSRYRRANDVLVREAALEPGLRVLDFGAGSGRTASAALRRLGPDGRIVCVEPSAAMRAAGCRRLRDARVTWRADLPSAHADERFDRILAGAMVWQLDPIEDWIRRLAALLRAGGALAFNVPALYLGEPDEDGGGSDPLLLDLMATLMAHGVPRRKAARPQIAQTWQCRRGDVETALRRAGLGFRTWQFRHRFTQVAFAHWLTIPVLTEGMLPDMEPAERDLHIARAFAAVDHRSYKWERWCGWTAWK